VENYVSPDTNVDDNRSEKNGQIVQSGNDAEKVSTSPPLIIGGKQYKGGLGDRVEYKEGGLTVLRFRSGQVNCTVEDINNLFIVSLWVDPENPESRNSLENLELLVKAKELSIRGENLDKVDFSPISSLISLEELKIYGNITRMPDLTKLERLRLVEINDAALESLEGIGGNVIETLFIRTDEINNRMLKISDMKNMPELRRFIFLGGKIDLQGINRFISLEDLSIPNCQPSNLEGIGKLKKLKYLQINLISPNPSISFLKDMTNLESISMYGNDHLYPLSLWVSWRDCEATQVLDISPLASSKKLRSISCLNFIIKNISALDALENDILGGITLYGSRLYDETEVSRHYLCLEFVSER
jgi:hypothetical protein